MTRRKNFISVVFVAILCGTCFKGILSNPVSHPVRNPSPYSYKGDFPASQSVPLPNSPKAVDNFKPKTFFKPSAVKAVPALKSSNPSMLSSSNSGSEKLFDPINRKSSWLAVPKKQFDDPKQRSKQHRTGAIYSPKWKPIRRFFDDPKAPKNQRKMKSANLKKLIKSAHRMQNDDDDDDDDDGGEYDGGADSAGSSGNGNGNGKKSMPMTIIRGFDVIAMDMPIGQKECKQPPPPVPEETEAPPGEDEVTEEEPDDNSDEQIGAPPEEETTPCATTEEITEPPKADTCLEGGGEAQLIGDRPGAGAPPASAWGDWSGCSKSCGTGVQSRSRVAPTGNAQQDTEFRPCHLADCPAEQVGVAPQYGYRNSVMSMSEA